MTEEEFFKKINCCYPINKKQEELLIKYLNLILEVNDVMDLTANTTKEEIIEKNFYDSIMSLYDYDYNDKELIDIGSGAGFPGILYAIIYPTLSVTLVEPMRKRADFLVRCKNELNLENVTVICNRVEDYFKNNEKKYDYASARGVAKLNILLELIVPILKVGGVFIALKSKKAFDEEKDAANALRILNTKRVKINQFLLPTNKETRINLYYKKEKETDKKYPRNYAQIKKKPL